MNCSFLKTVYHQASFQVSWRATLHKPSWQLSEEKASPFLNGKKNRLVFLLSPSYYQGTTGAPTAIGIFLCSDSLLEAHWYSKFLIPNPLLSFLKPAHYLYLTDLLCKGYNFQKLDSTFFQGLLSSSPPRLHSNDLLKILSRVLLFKNKIRYLIFSVKTSISFSVSLYSATHSTVCHMVSRTATV